jgi:hypothetical protein
LFKDILGFTLYPKDGLMNAGMSLIGLNSGLIPK